MTNLLTFENAKTTKGEKLGWRTAILYLKPYITGGQNLCPDSTPGCRASCLFTAGRGVMRNVYEARARKTVYFLQDKEAFIRQLIREIGREKIHATKEKMRLCVRLNGTADIPWENLGVINEFPDVQFYDYTKSYERVVYNRLKNYHLTFSLSETNGHLATKALEHGFNVAAVFQKELPPNWLGHKVINGDEHDLRFLDLSPCVVGLKAKGKARYDRLNFVLNTQIKEEVHA